MKTPALPTPNFGGQVIGETAVKIPKALVSTHTLALTSNLSPLVSPPESPPACTDHAAATAFPRHSFPAPLGHRNPGQLALTPSPLPLPAPASMAPSPVPLSPSVIHFVSPDGIRGVFGSGTTRSTLQPGERDLRVPQLPPGPNASTTRRTPPPPP